jgi:hypothetical protein
MKDLISSASSGCLSCCVLKDGIHALVEDSKEQDEWEIFHYPMGLQAKLSESTTRLELFTLRGKVLLYTGFYQSRSLLTLRVDRQ